MTIEMFSQDWRAIWRGHENDGEVGAVFTKPEIVSLILDLAGYTTDKRLESLTLIEPSCGDGAFLAVVVERLIASLTMQSPTTDWLSANLLRAIRAADIRQNSVEQAREAVRTRLLAAGCPEPSAIKLVETWIVQTDFLLAEWDFTFDFVVGNPPYVRIEDLPKRVLSEYRSSFPTTTDRADIYVAFFEKGLRLLSENGNLAYICANRFTKNKYGAALRRLVTSKYHVRYYVNLEHTQPFESEVSAYPAIFVIDRNLGRPTRATELTDISASKLQLINAALTNPTSRAKEVATFDSWFPDGGPWITTRKSDFELLQGLASTHPLIEESGRGTRVGIGVATGADSVFIIPQIHPAIEPDRQIPLAMPADITNAAINWSGHYVINPFSDISDGLVDLKEYPGLGSYLARHEKTLRARHVAKNRPASWFRTIDRIWPHLQHIEKLLIPDIQASTTIGLDRGNYYAHHNLYWIISEEWPLTALKCVLRSALVLMQVRAYSVQMRGGSLRYQAQTLRKLRVPAFQTITPRLVDELILHSCSDDQGVIDQLGAEVFASRKAA